MPAFLLFLVVQVLVQYVANEVGHHKTSVTKCILLFIRRVGLGAYLYKYKYAYLTLSNVFLAIQPHNDSAHSPMPLKLRD